MELNFPPINLYNMPKLQSTEFNDVLTAIDINDYKELNTPQPIAGIKYDGGKPRMDLLDFTALEGLAKVLTFGAEKYAAHNWRGGIHYSRLLSAMLRHISAIQRGEYIDPESGLPHIHHVGCCWMFLANMMETRPDMNDLWRPDESSEGVSR